MVLSKRDSYLDDKTKKLEKAHIAAQIVYMIRAMNPPGRFLKEDPDGSWWDIGDQKAIKKVGQALREDGVKGEDSPPAKSASEKKSLSLKKAPLVPETPSSMAPPPIAVSSRGGRVGLNPSIAPPLSNAALSYGGPIFPHPTNTQRNSSGGFAPRSTTISGAAAAAVSGYDDEFPVPAQVNSSHHEIWNKGFYPADQTSNMQPDTSMLSGTSNPSYMSNVSEISGLTVGSGVSASNNMVPTQQQSKQPSHRMVELGHKFSGDAGPTLDDLQSLMSHDDNLSSLLRDADAQSCFSKQYLDELSTLSGQLTAMSIGDSTAVGSSTLYEL